jgi:hypothetical protein
MNKSSTYKGRGRNHMTIGFTTTMQSVSITTNVVSSNPVHGKMYSIKFVSDLRQVGGFLRFPPPTGLTATI